MERPTRGKASCSFREPASALKTQPDCEVVALRESKAYVNSDVWQFLSLEVLTGKSHANFAGDTLARAEGLEPSTLGFGDRCSTN